MSATTDLPPIGTVYPTLPSLLRKFDRYARRDAFPGGGPEDFRRWQGEMKTLLRDLLGLDKMERCPLDPVKTESIPLPGGIVRERWTIRTEPDVVLPFYVLLPPGAGRHTRPFLCPPGHGGAGKASVAGLREYPAVAEKIAFYNYDYGLQLCRLGYAAICPDARGFGERREEPESTKTLPGALAGDCCRLARMGEPLGIPVAGMLTWDLMRLLDYAERRGDWDGGRIGCLGFSGGGMQTLWLAALDGRVGLAVISGYLYGYKDALLTLNENCSCNYVPHLWEHLDMGDIASLIAPRPLLVQSCRGDRLNGPRGLANVLEQVDTVRAAYRLLGAQGKLIHEICEGPHRWHGERLGEHLRALS